MRLRHRLAAAWKAFLHADAPPAYAVIYDVPEVNNAGVRTGDASEEYYETFATPGEALELFRMAFREDDPVPVENARLVMILGDIDDYAGVP